MRDRVAAAIGTCALLVSACASVVNVPAFPETPDASKSYDVGTTHLRAGRYEAAADEYRRSLEIESDPFVCRIRLGLAYYGQGQFGEAADQFRIACDSFGGVDSAPPLCILQVLALQRAGEFEQAQELLEVWSAPNIGFAGTAGAFSTASGRLPSGWWKTVGKYLLGEADEEEVLDIDPARVEYLSYLIVGIENVVRGDTDKAQTFLLKLQANASKSGWRYDFAEIEIRRLAETKPAQPG